MSFKKFTAALSTLAIALTSVFTFGVAVEAATTFTDASKIDSWASASVSSLVEAGVIAGRADGSFDPQGSLNRAEMAKIAALSAGFTLDSAGAAHFNDVAASDWFYPYVETLYRNGVVGGINGGALDSNGLASYNPAGALNRAEAAKILVDAFDLEKAYAGTPPNFPDVTKDAWYFDYVESAYAHGLLNGYTNGNFGPSDVVTRQQVAVIAQAGREEAGKVTGVAAGSKRRSGYQAGAASSVAATTTPTDPTNPTASKSDGALNVALAATTAPAQTFPAGASGTAVAAYSFTASSAGAVVINNLSVKRTGVGNDSDWNLYLYDGANRLTSGKTINSTSHEALFASLNVSVAAGTTKTLILKADTTESLGGDSYFEIASAAAVGSNAASVTGTFPVRSNKQEVNGSVTAGSITIEKNGSITNPKVGEDDVVVAKFKLTANVEAANVSQIALIVDGKVSPTDVQNAKLYQGTTLLATATGVNSKDLLVFTLATPFRIEKGDSRNFEVKADLNTGRNADDLSIYLDEDADILATGGNYGFGMSVNNSYGSANASTCTLQGGDITISSSGPSAADIAVNGKDVALMNFNITSASAVTFKKFGIGFITADTGNADATTAGGLMNNVPTTPVANYTDIKIINKDTGAVVMGPIDANNLASTDELSGSYTFSDEFAMTAGQSLNLSVIADIANNTHADFVDDTVKIQIVTSALEIKDVNNKTIVNSTSVVPTNNIDGKIMSVKASSLTATRSSTPTSTEYVKGSKGVSLLGVSLVAGASSTSKITEMTFRVRADDDTTFLADQVSANDYVSNLELWINGTKVAGPKGLTLDGTNAAAGYYKAVFTNMSYTVPAGGTVQAILKGDLSTNVTGNIYIGASILPSADIVAEDKDGNTITASSVDGLELNGLATQNPAMTISTGGTLTIAADPDTPRTNIVVAGTSDVAVAKFRLSATKEDFIIKKLELKNTGNDVNVVAVNLSYKNSAGTTETKIGYLSNSKVSFTGLDMLVPKDSNAVLTVSANLNTISAGAVASGKVDLDISDNGTDPSNFEAVAQGSGETYTGTSEAVSYTSATVVAATKEMVVYETKPTVTLASTSPSGNRTASTSDGVFKFTVAADSKEAVIIKKITVKLNGALLNVADNAKLKEGSTDVATATYTPAANAASLVFTPATAIEVAKGTSKTFTVEIDTTKVVSIDTGDDLLTPSIFLGVSGTASADAGLIWDDSNNSNTGNGIFWVGDVENTTLNGNTLKY